MIIKPGIGRRIGPRRAAYWTLIDADHSIEMFPAENRRAGAGIPLAALQSSGNGAIEDIHYERAFPRARHPGHARHDADRNVHVRFLRLFPSTFRTGRKITLAPRRFEGIGTCAMPDK